MSAIVLYEDEGFARFLPLTYWRSVFELRVGHKILLDRVAQQLKKPVTGIWTREWIARVAAQRCGAPANHPLTAGTTLINGRWLPPADVKLPPEPCVGLLENEIAFVVCDARIAQGLVARDLLDPARRQDAFRDLPRVHTTGHWLRYPWEIVAQLDRLLREDWEAGDPCIEIDLEPGTTLVNREAIHIGERSRIHPSAVIDATDGPIHISHDVRVGACAVIEGPAYVGPGTRINAHAWLHGGNAVGPVCRVGGELDACVLHGYTNKQHHGFLGHSYVGSWINIGAGASNSDLKNTYGHVRVPLNGTDVDTGLRFFGAIIGDHAKIGINATIPTGAVIGLAASAAGTRVLPKFTPSFSWIVEDRATAGDPLRALDVAATMMARRDVDMTDEEVELFLDLGTRVQEYESSARPSA